LSDLFRFKSRRMSYEKLFYIMVDIDLIDIDQSDCLSNYIKYLRLVVFLLNNSISYML